MHQHHQPTLIKPACIMSVCLWQSPSGGGYVACHGQHDPRSSDWISACAKSPKHPARLPCAPHYDSFEWLKKATRPGCSWSCLIAGWQSEMNKHSLYMTSVRPARIHLGYTFDQHNMNCAK
jgi:hypothetical protein